MPGLLRGMARTAAIAGTATAVSNRVSRRQAERWSQEDQPANMQQVPLLQTAPSEDAMDQLTKLGQLHDQGILTDEEFTSKKAEILQRM